MRKLMWFTVGFAAACAAVVYLDAGVWLAAACLPLAVVNLLLKKKYTAITAVILIGVTVGSLWSAGYDALYLSTARGYDGKTVSVEATVADFSYDTNYGVAADGIVALDGKTYRVRLYMESGEPLSPGDIIKGKFRFRLTTADSLQGETYHQGEGIFLLAYGEKNCQVSKAESAPLRFFGATVRRRVSQLLCTALPADTAPFANALLLGDSSMLDYATDTDFKLSGVRHVIAVSGLHVSILMSVVYIFSGRRRYLSAIIGIPVLLAFAAVIGFTPSVTRACIMQILILLALAFNQEYDPPTALAFAVLTMLCVNPLTIVSVSFQLSTGCLIGIFLFYQRIQSFFLRKLKMEKVKTKKDRFLYGLCSSVSITLSTMVTTTPLSAAYFGTISLVGVLTNLLTLWIISFIFCGLLLICLAGLVWMKLATLLGWVIAWPIRYVIWAARLLGSLTYSAVYTCSTYIVIWIVMCYLLFGVCLLCKRKRPLLLLGGAVAGLILALFLSWAEPLGDNYRFTVFDVGQGQSILFECDGKKILVDCGGETDKQAADTVAQHLRSRSVTRLDAVIVTHYDKDHVGGIPLLLSEIPADTLYLPDVPDESGLRETLSNAHNNVQWVTAYGQIKTEIMKLTMITGEHETNDNERSMCVLFQTENCDILITGDRSEAGEKALLESARLPQVDILVAGHHGSASATGLELLNAVRPKIAVISVAKNNHFGHPSDTVLYRLGLFKCRIYRTDTDGTVVFRG